MFLDVLMRFRSAYISSFSSFLLNHLTVTYWLITNGNKTIKHEKDHISTYLSGLEQQRESNFQILTRVHGKIPVVNGFVPSLNPDLFSSLLTSLMSSPSVYFI